MTAYTWSNSTLLGIRPYLGQEPPNMPTPNFYPSANDLMPPKGLAVKSIIQTDIDSGSFRFTVILRTAEVTKSDEKQIWFKSFN
jgi:hypothetical protein